MSAGSANGVRRSTGIVAGRARRHRATCRPSRAGCLPAPSAREREACPWGTTALYEIVRDNIETLWPKARLRARGFARLKCRACGETRLLAFSCKGRGFCPSCMGRRMSGASGPLGARKAWPWATTAANLIERVLPPSTALRQWVLTFPFSWRPRLAQEREACPWGTANCSVGSPRSSWIARSLALGHGAGVLCPSSGPGGRQGCEDRRGHCGTEDIVARGQAARCASH